MIKIFFSARAYSSRCIIGVLVEDDIPIDAVADICSLQKDDTTNICFKKFIRGTKTISVFYFRSTRTYGVKLHFGIESYAKKTIRDLVFNIREQKRNFKSCSKVIDFDGSMFD